MNSSQAFWIDADHDREMASDGRSRYGHYVRDRAERFREAWDLEESRPARFAATAWRVATGPIMAPGYVRRNPRLLSGQVEVNDWDGSLVGMASLVTPWPLPLASSRDWRADGTWWRDWPTETIWGSDTVRYLDPSGEDLSRGQRFLMASAALVFPLPTQPLPALPPAPAPDLAAQARAYVEVLVAEMNRVVAPVLDTLERS
ncbi:hypothetical protein [Nonomuraea zeae]|uniref:Uncharacterized protein n=1 Tax=Nonomuraea zeae TaxID=1642303 RepID=A0A5S4HJP7_9ACTN|nr:hypothetical protein [Nonomuraea zeae]TMR39630.1 hypothetical protein ETD85_01050 [Nonomuraea zeae]